MLKADEEYLHILQKIVEDGWMAPNRTEYNAQKVIQQMMVFDLGAGELPIIKSKKVAWKTAILEMLWIYQKQSNVVQDLKDMTKAAFGRETKIWDEWCGPDGTIGKAYGYQVAKTKQIDKLIRTLKTDPQSRRMMINIWNEEDLAEMNIEPCCFLTMWDVTDGKLSCTLVQRSCDMGLGVPFNMIQFAALQTALAWATGLELGTFCHILQNAHIYENQMVAIKEQMRDAEAIINDDYLADMNISIDEFEQIRNCKPTLRMAGRYSSYDEISVDEALERFYSLTIDDFIIEDYYSMPKREMGKVAGGVY